MVRRCNLGIYFSLLLPLMDWLLICKFVVTSSSMRLTILLTAVFVYLLPAGSRAQDSDSATIKKISDEILTNGKAYENLRYLCKKIGPRLSGSPQAQQAVEATFRMLKEAGADTVYLQPCMVPHWVRGKRKPVILSCRALPAITFISVHWATPKEPARKDSGLKWWK